MTPRTNPRRWILPLALGSIVLGVGLLVFAVTSYFRLSADARSLRNSLHGSALQQGAAWDEKVELSVGAITLHVVRAGLSFAPLDPEIRAALQAARGAEVGIYQLRSPLSEINRSALLSAADTAMERRGWEKLVGVRQGHELVAIYVPKVQPTPTQTRACAAVLHDNQLVLVSARTDLEPLLELALKRPEWTEPKKRLVRL